MAKSKSQFICAQCGFQNPKWLGQCPQCETWGSLEEVLLSLNKKSVGHALDFGTQVTAYHAVETLPVTRFSSGSKEFDRVLGGGFVPGSVLLIGGEPGVGKSTLLLQVGSRISLKRKTLYLSGEESAGQIKIRGMRLGIERSELMLAHETRLEALMALLDQTQPDFVVIDSIQTLQSLDLSSPSGTVSQVRACAQRLIDWAKPRSATVLLVGHITKEGVLAGPKALEHMVDGVFLFEGEKTSELRLLRAQKNRFGPGGELGVFRMLEQGLRAVDNPSELLLHQRPERTPGSVVVPCVEGSRVFMVEVQVLTGSTSYPSPRRLAMGLDPNRLALILAVLEKKAGLQIQGYDVFANVVGGMQIREPALDLGLALAVYSAFRNLPLATNVAVFGEVGLAGEVRSVPKWEQRLRECRHFGFSKIIMPPQSIGDADAIGVKHLIEALERAL